MSTETAITQVLSGLEKSVDQTIEVIDLELNHVIDIPMLKDLKDVNQLYDGYRETVIGYQGICNSVALLVQIQIRLRELKMKLPTTDILPSLKASVKTRIEYTLGKIDLCRQSAVVIKDRYDARLRFYGSTQYMLSSSRYNEIKY